MLNRLRDLDRSSRAMIGLALAIVLFFAVNILSNTTFKSMQLDLTDDKLFTLSEGTLNIIGDLDEPLTLRFYFSNSALQSYPSLINYGNRVRDMLREYAAKSDGNIELIVIEPEAFSEEPLPGAG